MTPAHPAIWRIAEIAPGLCAGRPNLQSRCARFWSGRKEKGAARSRPLKLQSSSALCGPSSAYLARELQLARQHDCALLQPVANHVGLISKIDPRRERAAESRFNFFAPAVKS